MNRKSNKITCAIFFTANFAQVITVNKNTADIYWRVAKPKLQM